MASEATINAAKAEVVDLESRIAELQAKYDAELPNREAGNGAEATRLFNAMRPLKRKLEMAKVHLNGL